MLGPVLTVAAKLLDAPMKQALLGVTDTLPEFDPKATVIEVVPWPVKVAPEGTIHV
jgi:hypothetical protein